MSLQCSYTTKVKEQDVHLFILRNFNIASVVPNLHRVQVSLLINARKPGSLNLILSLLKHVIIFSTSVSTWLYGHKLCLKDCFIENGLKFPKRLCSHRQQLTAPRLLHFKFALFSFIFSGKILFIDKVRNMCLPTNCMDCNTQRRLHSTPPNL